MKRVLSVLLATMMLLLILAPATNAMAESGKQKVYVTLKDYTSSKGIKSAPYTIKNSKGTVVKSGKTDSNGKASTSLAPGTYTLSVTGLSGYVKGSKAFTVSKEKNASVSLTLKKLATLSVTFRDRHGDSFSGTVYLKDETTGKIVYHQEVGSSGKKSIKLTPGHRYYGYIYDDNEREGFQYINITAAPGKVYSKCPSFQPRIRITVTLLDVNGYAVPDQLVEIPSMSIRVHTNSKGVAVINGVPYGKTVKVTSNRAGSKSVTVEGKHGSSINITLRANYRQLKITTPQVEKPGITTEYNGIKPVKTKKPLDYME